MGAGTSWFVSILAMLGLVLALHQLGVNVGSSLGTLLHGAVQLLGQPLSAAA